jgi:hypothetical protein
VPLSARSWQLCSSYPESPKVRKSPCSLRTTHKHPAGPTLSENGSIYSCPSGFLGRCFSRRVFRTINLDRTRAHSDAAAGAKKRSFFRTAPFDSEDGPTPRGAPASTGRTGVSGRARPVKRDVLTRLAGPVPVEPMGLHLVGCGLAPGGHLPWAHFGPRRVQELHARPRWRRRT